MQYLAHPVLGPRLRAAAAQFLLLLRDPINNEREKGGLLPAMVLGHARDEARVRSCITLFATMSLGEEDSVFFMRVLNTVWNGELCGMTLQILDAWVSKKLAA